MRDGVLASAFSKFDKAMPDSEAKFIDVNDLRVGMYVFLDLDWMKHPFALNSFRIASLDQIETIRGFGIGQIRWSREQSDPELFREEEKPPAAPNGNLVARQAVVDAVVAEAEVLRQRRQLLAAQQEGLAACERQFTVAAHAFRQVMESADTQPDAARNKAEQIVGGMVDKMLEQEESDIRLLSENAGEKSSLHAVNITIIALLLGKGLGLDAAELADLGTGALLHDIGKMRLAERLRWPDPDFNAAELELHREHVAHGLAIGQAMQLAPRALAVIAEHHELADGSGYPRRLAGEAIALSARICALVNQYDNLCNPQNPTLALTPHSALSQIYAQMRRHYDPEVLTPFIRMMGVYPPGSAVELTDGRYALVVSVNSLRPLKPRIVIFEPRVPRTEAMVEDLEQLPKLGIRRSLKPLQLPRAVYDYLSPRKRLCYYFERARPNGESEVPS
jgi:putative nucleotidyltransferase with HDIG domain